MRGFGLIGPLAAWELRRLARRGLALRVRLLLLYVLLLAFVGFAAVWFAVPTRGVFVAPARLSLAEAAAFAHAFALVMLEAQLVAVVAFTPALAASAVSEEKDRHTLPLLLTTELTDREIVFGKAIGRTVFVLAAVFAGVPVLALTLPFGGVDVGFLVVGYALTAGTAVLCAAIGVSAACRTPDLRSAVVRAYGRTAVFVCGALVPPCVLLTPFGVLARVHGEAGGWAPALGYAYAGAQAVAAFALLVGAARSLRLREPSAGPPAVTAFPAPPRPADPPLVQPDRAAPRALPPLDAANPVLWKERCAGFRPDWGVPSVARLLSALTAALVVALFAGGAWALGKRVGWSLQPDEAVPPQPPGAGDSSWLLMTAGVFAAGRYLFPLAVGVSGTIAGERFRGTLDALLTTPLPRRGVLRAKVQAHAERGVGFATAAAAGVGMAFTADGGARLGAAAAALVLAGVGLIIGLGAWLTVRCATDSRALRLLLPLTVLVVGWPVGAWNWLRADAEVTVEELTGGLFAAAGACAVVGLALWRLAGRALERGA